MAFYSILKKKSKIILTLTLLGLYARNIAADNQIVFIDWPFDQEFSSDRIST